MILSQLIDSTTNLRALAAELDVPVLSGLQHQGDLSVIPAHMVTEYRNPRTLVPAAGIAVIRGESNGNTHLLLAAGPVRFDAGRTSGMTVGHLRVFDEAEAYLDHPEHGNTGIAPGRYVLRRKREMSSDLRLVAD